MATPRVKTVGFKRHAKPPATASLAQPKAVRYRPPSLSLSLLCPSLSYLPLCVCLCVSLCVSDVCVCVWVRRGPTARPSS
jgi:hypothetical protein